MLNNNKRKNVLYLTGIYPTKEIPYGGEFLKERLKILRTYTFLKVYPLALYEDEKVWLRIAKKIVRMRTITPLLDIGWINFKKVKLDVSEYYIHSLSKFIRYPLGVAKYYKRYEKSLEDTIREIGMPVHLIHVHWLYPHAIAVGAIKEKFGIPYIVTIHGSDINQLAGKKPPFYKNTVIKMLNYADAVIFVSKDLLNKALNLGFKGHRYAVIPNGVDTKLFKPMSKFSVREKLGLSIYKRYIGFIGSLTYAKGADRVLDIFKYISRKNNDIILLLIGDGELKPSIFKKIKKENLKNVYLLGKQPHTMLPFWLNALDILVLPSRNEGWPTIIMEAFACGIPVVASRVGGIPEMIRRSYLGIVVDEAGGSFTERFGNAIMQVLHSHVDANIIKIREYVEQFSWNKIVTKEVNLYKKIWT